MPFCPAALTTCWQSVPVRAIISSTHSRHNLRARKPRHSKNANSARARKAVDSKLFVGLEVDVTFEVTSRPRALRELAIFTAMHTKSILTTDGQECGVSWGLQIKGTQEDVLVEEM